MGNIQVSFVCCPLTFVRFRSSDTERRNSTHVGCFDRNDEDCGVSFKSSRDTNQCTSTGERIVLLEELHFLSIFMREHGSLCSFQNGETALMKACSCVGRRQWDTQNTTKRMRTEPNCAEYAVIVKMLLDHPGTMVNMQDNVRMSIIVSCI